MVGATGLAARTRFAELRVLQAQHLRFEPLTVRIHGTAIKTKNGVNPEGPTPFLF
jgi:hypothetical protein